MHAQANAMMEKALMKSLLRMALAVLLFFVYGGACFAEEIPSPRFKAVAFDYFVIFNPDSVMPEVEKVFPGKGKEFTKMWRSKQFEYGFLRSITGRHEDFFKVTDDALVYTAEILKLDLTAENRHRLLDAYLNLKPWPDVVASLQKLKASGVRVITISNFSADMLRSNAQHAGIEDLFDELLSTEVNATYKPDPRAYALGMEHLNLAKDEILFVAFGGWDAYGAKNFGYPTYWVNRFALPVEKLGIEADNTSNSLDGVVSFVLGPRGGIVESDP